MKERAIEILYTDHNISASLQGSTGECVCVCVCECVCAGVCVCVYGGLGIVLVCSVGGFGTV